MIPILFKCNSCGNQIDIRDIEDDIMGNHYEDIISACEDFKYSAREVLLFGYAEGIEFIGPDDKYKWYYPDAMADALIPYNYDCPHCKQTLELYIWCWFSVEYNHWNPFSAFYVGELDNIMIVDIKNAAIQENFGIYEGGEILGFLKHLIYRWASLEYKFVIIMPFIDTHGWFEILKDVFDMHSSSFIGKIDTTLFLTRPYGARTGIKTLEDMREEHCKECDQEFQTHEPPCFDGVCIWDKHAYPNFPLIGEVQPSKKNFHAKLLAGISPNGLVECILTSYNFIVAESKQFETFDFRLMNESCFNSKFLDSIKAII